MQYKCCCPSLGTRLIHQSMFWRKKSQLPKLSYDHHIRVPWPAHTHHTCAHMHNKDFKCLCIGAFGTKTSLDAQFLIFF